MKLVAAAHQAAVTKAIDVKNTKMGSRPKYADSHTVNRPPEPKQKIFADEIALNDILRLHPFPDQRQLRAVSGRIVLQGTAVYLQSLGQEGHGAHAGFQVCYESDDGDYKQYGDYV